MLLVEGTSMVLYRILLLKQEPGQPYLMLKSNFYLEEWKQQGSKSGRCD